MTLEELLESYNPIDVAYDKRFPTQETTYAHFIPSKEEIEKIFLIDPLGQLVNAEEDDE